MKIRNRFEFSIGRTANLWLLPLLIFSQSAQGSTPNEAFWPEPEAILETDSVRGDSQPVDLDINSDGAIEVAYCPRMSGFPTMEAKRRAERLAQQNAARQALQRRTSTARQLATIESKREQISKDQLALSKLGYYKGVVDGKVSPKMESAIADFRKAQGGGSFKTLDAKSREILHSGYAAPKANGNSPLKTSTINSPPSLTKAPPANSTLAAPKYSNQASQSSPGAPTAKLNSSTQTHKDLSALDPATRRIVERVYSAQKRSNTASVSASTASRSTTSVGLKSHPVVKAKADSQLKSDQEALQALGYYQTKVDGISGPATRKAIDEFRRDQGLGSGTTLDQASRSILYSKTRNVLAGP